MVLEREYGEVSQKRHDDELHADPQKDGRLVMELPDEILYVD